MDRSLKWRTVALVAAVLFCLNVLAPSVVPNWLANVRWPLTMLKSKKINLGLDLQGGLHIVYSIDLDKAVDDRASEMKRNIEARMSDEKIKGVVKTPASPLGAVTVLLEDPSKRADVLRGIDIDYGDNVVKRDCAPGDGPNAVCVRVSSKFSECRTPRGGRHDPRADQREGRRRAQRRGEG